MNTDYRPSNSWDFRLRAAKLGELMSVRSLATLTLTVALIALLATLATLLAPPLQAQSITHEFVNNVNTEWGKHQQRLSSSELRNWHQLGWLHGLQG